MKISTTGGKVIIELDDTLERRLTMEGEKDIGGGKTLFLVRTGEIDTVPQMRVGRIVGLSRGMWRTVCGRQQFFEMPSTLKIGMLVCVPPFRLDVFEVNGRKLVAVNPHAIMGRVILDESGANTAIL